MAFMFYANPEGSLIRRFNSAKLYKRFSYVIDYYLLFKTPRDFNIRYVSPLYRKRMEEDILDAINLAMYLVDFHEMLGKNAEITEFYDAKERSNFRYNCKIELANLVCLSDFQEGFQEHALRMRDILEFHKCKHFDVYFKYKYRHERQIILNWIQERIEEMLEIMEAFYFYEEMPEVERYIIHHEDSPFRCFLKYIYINVRPGWPEETMRFYKYGDFHLNKKLHPMYFDPTADGKVIIVRPRLRRRIVRRRR